MPDDAFIVGIYLSPDNKHKAVVFKQIGGGGISPYCFHFVSVTNSELEDRLAWNNDKKVFAASCGALGSDKDLNGVEWMSSKELAITFDINLAIRRVSALTLKSYADGGQVHLTYMPQRPLVPIHK